MNNSEKNILTIREAIRRCQEEKLPLSEYTLRRWVKAGVIPSCQAGTKALIYFPNLMAYLLGKDFDEPVRNAD